MAEVMPLRGVRYNASRVSLDRVLAPPYDVIDAAMRAELYERDEHNIVRIDCGEDHAGDREGVSDRHSRAATLLEEWLGRSILVRDTQPALYVTDHEFPLAGGGEG
ncbi:MAG: DUF1015 family protein, partial [Candidatus Dormibacteria bacterium]